MTVLKILITCELSIGHFFQLAYYTNKLQKATYDISDYLVISMTRF